MGQGGGTGRGSTVTESGAGLALPSRIEETRLPGRVGREAPVEELEEEVEFSRRIELSGDAAQEQVRAREGSAAHRNLRYDGERIR